MPEIPEPVVRRTEYQVSCVPDDCIDADVFMLTVRYRGDGRWAVCRGHSRDLPCLDADGEWSWGVDWEDGQEAVTEQEIAAYNAAREEWLDAHRFDEETALRLAKQFAPQMTVNGWTVADALARREEHHA
jgi:hypothetical protein